jgi:hypothetical protein
LLAVLSFTFTDETEKLPEGGGAGGCVFFEQPKQQREKNSRK